MTVTLALAGDAILTRRFGDVGRSAVDGMLAPLRAADAGVVHLEGTICEADASEVVPAAEAGGTWLRGPPGVATDLADAGVDLVTHASNHALDFGRGGLAATRDHLDAAGVSAAGTGSSLAAARLPTYLETAGARLAVVSASTAVQPHARAGEQRRDCQGRPGVNPLRTHYAAGPDRLETIRELAEATGQWVESDRDALLVHPPGLHNSASRYHVRDEPGIERVLDERDRAGMLRAISDGDRRADITLAHVHAHAWATGGDLSDPPAFLRAFAHDCVEVGADIVCCQGSHAPLRGLEVVDGALICYDPGTFVDTAESSERLPADFYERYAPELPADATPGEALAARAAGDGENASAYSDGVANPPGGYFSGDVLGTTLIECRFDDDLSLESVELVPGELADGRAIHEGFPVTVDGDRAAEIIGHVADLAAPFDTTVRFEDGRGVVAV